MPADILITPFWTGEWDTGAVRKSGIAFALTGTHGGESTLLAFERPISITWRYRDHDLDGLSEEQLRLFLTEDSLTWQTAQCEPYLRTPSLNFLQVGICRSGLFLFGNRFDVHLPHVTAPASATSSNPEPIPNETIAAPDQDNRRSPLLLPEP